MDPEKFAFGVAVALFASGALGMIIRLIVPEPHITGPARDMIDKVVGLLSLLTALVLGLLVWTGYGVYAGQNQAIQAFAAKALQYDLALSDYGPDAAAARLQLRDSLGKTIDEVWGANNTDFNFVAKNFAAGLHNLRQREATLKSLHPSTDDQRQALEDARSTMDAMAQSRLQMSFALSQPYSLPLLMTVVGWLVILFFGYGLTSKGSVTTVTGVVIGSAAVASAFFIILELSSPYLGAFRVSPAPLEQVLAVMGKE